MPELSSLYLAFTRKGPEVLHVIGEEGRPGGEGGDCAARDGLQASGAQAAAPEAADTAATAEEVAGISDGEWAYLWRRRQDILLRSLTNRLYQQERRRIFQGRDGTVKLLSLVAGSAALANLAGRPQIMIAAAGVVAVGSAVSLVFRWSDKCVDASRRADEWAELERSIAASGERGFTEQDLDAWTARAIDIELGEAAQNSALRERCFERACRAIGSNPMTPRNWLDRRLYFFIP